MTAPALPDLTAVEAQDLTERICATASNLWMLLEKAHDRKAWKALGYSSWADYCAAEFDMGRSHAYRLLDQAKVIHALEVAAELSPIGDTEAPVVSVSIEQARDLKPVIDEVADEIAAAVTEDMTVTEKHSVIHEIAERKRAEQKAAKEAAKAPEGVDPETGEIAPDPQPEPTPEPAPLDPAAELRSNWLRDVVKVRTFLSYDISAVVAALEPGQREQAARFAADVEIFGAALKAELQNTRTLRLAGGDQ